MYKQVLPRDIAEKDLVEAIRRNSRSVHTGDLAKFADFTTTFGSAE